MGVIHITTAIALFFMDVLLWEIMRMAAAVAAVALGVLFVAWLILRAARHHHSGRSE
jgi:hypothetical protein